MTDYFHNLLKLAQIFKSVNFLVGVVIFVDLYAFPAKGPVQ